MGAYVGLTILVCGFVLGNITRHNMELIKKREKLKIRPIKEGDEIGT